jgi:hypothetical protein
MQRPKPYSAEESCNSEGEIQLANFLKEFYTSHTFSNYLKTVGSKAVNAGK